MRKKIIDFERNHIICNHESFVNLDDQIRSSRLGRPISANGKVVKRENIKTVLQVLNLTMIIGI